MGSVAGGTGRGRELSNGGRSAVKEEDNANRFRESISRSMSH